MPPSPLARYLARVGLPGPVPVDPDGLTRLHVAHTGAIPFENFDIQMGRSIRVEPEAVVEKLVGQRRGGYCFEQNTLLYGMLGLMGFKVRRVMARVMLDRPEPGPRTHLMLLVTFGDRQVIADVGFGGHGLIAPLPLLPRTAQEILGEGWRVMPSTWSEGFEVQARLPAGWSPLYWFDPREPVVDADVAMANHFTSTHLGSRFLPARIAARNTPGCRRSLLNHEFKRRQDGTLTVTAIADETHLRRILADEFLIDLPDGADLKPVPA